VRSIDGHADFCPLRTLEFERNLGIVAGKFVAASSKTTRHDTSTHYEVGDRRGGFELIVDIANRIVHMRFWGIWDRSIGEQSLAAVLKAGREMSGAPWGILADSTAFMAQADEITELRRKAMAGARELGCVRIAAVSAGGAYTLQFRRICVESKLEGAVFHEKTAAMKWLLETLHGPTRTSAGRPPSHPPRGDGESSRRTM
jgi:hypothetical protein